MLSNVEAPGRMIFNGERWVEAYYFLGKSLGMLRCLETGEVHHHHKVQRWCSYLIQDREFHQDLLKMVGQCYSTISLLSLSTLRSISESSRMISFAITTPPVQDQIFKSGKPTRLWVEWQDQMVMILISNVDSD